MDTRSLIWGMSDRERSVSPALSERCHGVRTVEEVMRAALKDSGRTFATISPSLLLESVGAGVWRVCAGLVGVYAGVVRDVSGRNMDKRSAMKIVNEHLGSRLLDGGNTSFANINASKPVWWININPSKFKSDLHLLLVKEGDRGLVWLRIEGDSFPDVRKVFRVRQDNDYIDLEISSRRPEYMTDVKSGGTEYDFAKHIEHEWGPAQHGRNG